jgi:hypothetical protein
MVETTTAVLVATTTAVLLPSLFGGQGMAPNVVWSEGECSY